MRICLCCGNKYKHKKETQTTCSKSCAQKYRNPEIEIKRNCGYCGKEMILNKRRSKVMFCSQSCVNFKKWQSEEYRAKCHNEESNRNRSEARLKFNNTDKGKADIAESSSRMRHSNPAKNPVTVCKALNTRRINGTLNVWMGKHGGNGELTPAQMLLASALGWRTEYAISLGELQKGYPTNYKIDIAEPTLKIGIEVDGKGHNSEKAKYLDNKKTEKLKEFGWIILRFSNSRILNNLDRVLLMIQSTIKTRSVECL